MVSCTVVCCESYGWWRSTALNSAACSFVSRCHAGAHSYLEELSAIYDQGSNKLDKIGYSGFFGADMTERYVAQVGRYVWCLG